MVRDVRPADREIAEEQSSLWRLAFAPTIWALHFVASYGFAALSCAKFPDWTLAGLPAWRTTVFALSAVALAAILWIGWQAWRQWDFLDDFDYSHHTAETESRHEFLGHAGFLLAVLSVLGVLATTLPAILIRTCL
ncbi:hypothetical protein [Roseivivax sp. CAU 1761]